MITLLTDFGARDYFVPAIKGVILSINPATQIIDITHEIPAQDIAEAAFTLGACWRNFPSGVIHLAVVDPGVGSARRTIAVEAAGQFFVGPDNGLFSFVYLSESPARVFHITQQKYFRHPVSGTFHGRDVFAPIAAHLSLGLKLEEFGEQITDYVRIEMPRPRIVGQRITGHVIHIDRFGNCITNLAARELSAEQACQARVLFCQREIKQFGTHFAEAADKTELFAYQGSAGFWEVAFWRDSAMQKLGAQRGDEIVVELV